MTTDIPVRPRLPITPEFRPAVPDGSRLVRIDLDQLAEFTAPAPEPEGGRHRIEAALGGLYVADTRRISPAKRAAALAGEQPTTPPPLPPTPDEAAPVAGSAYVPRPLTLGEQARKLGMLLRNLGRWTR